MIDPTTIVFPGYDGNGMVLSMGNIAGDGRIGLLFMDYERPHRVRAHAHAVVDSDDPMMNNYPGADLIVRATMVRWEAAIIGTFGAALGVVLGVGLGYALTRTLRNQGISTIEVPYRSLVIMSLLVTVAGVGPSLYPARRASKLNVLRAIASE